MGRVLILGSSPTSEIGAALFAALTEKGDTVTFASRATGCDVTNAGAVRSLVAAEKPEVIILAAGVFPEPRPLGEVEDWSKVGQVVAAKTLGAMIVLDAAVRCGGVRSVSGA